MGNVINKDNDTINWNNVKTDNFSDNNKNKFLTDDSKLLISKLTLNIPNPVESDEISDVEKIFSKYKVLNNTENKVPNELSDTSPFISSDMYNYLMTKNVDQPKQTGGAIKEDSSTSSTSSSSDSNTNKNKKNVNHKKTSVEEPSSRTLSSSDSEKNGDDLSYVSSSAHTEKEASESASESESASSSENNDNNNSTTQSGGKSVSNDNNDLPPSSINTSDINMISESS
jgi:hypothetical protein